jgi:uncharacterized membrane protein
MNVRLERLLAGLLYYGTWVASGVIALGLMAFGTNATTLGIAVFILLPVLRLAVMAAAFIWQKDYRFGLISGLVLAIIGLGLALGMHVET